MREQLRSEVNYMQNQQKHKRLLRIRRHKRVRGRIAGVPSRPRLSVFRSAKNLYAQIIDDDKGVTLVSVTAREVKGTGTKAECSYALGALLAKKAKAKGIENVVFDRGGFRYHGRVQQFAEGARKEGLIV